MKRYFLPSGVELMNVHDEDKCEGEVCVVHNPTDHPMSDWPLHWREDQAIFERICPHGVGHFDPDQLPFWLETGQEWRAIHCCDLVDGRPCCSDRMVETTEDTP